MTPWYDLPKPPFALTFLNLINPLALCLAFPSYEKGFDVFGLPGSIS